MKIVEVTATVCSKDFSGVAMRFGVGQNIKRDAVVIKVSAEDGTIGWGESHHAMAPTAIAEIINQSLAPLVIGQDALDREGIWDRVFRAQIQTTGTGTAATIALSGVDIALWDLGARLLKMPVWQLLGGRPKPIRAYAGGLSLGFKPLEELEREVRDFVELGYTAVKLRAGQSPKADAERIGHIRRTFGDDLDIAIDAGTRYRRIDIPEIADFAERFRLFWIEEPFAPDDFPAYSELKKRTAIPLAMGENHFTRRAFRDLLVQGIVDVVQPDCTKSGGISEVKKIADMAAAWNVQFAPHTSQSIISAAANLHVLSAVSNGLIHEADLAPENPFRDELASNPPQMDKGSFTTTMEVGLGLEINQRTMEAHPGIPGPCYLPAAQ